ncbi:hypothetical protein [Caedibacter taeniospiralis]|uniref:hypothetical protein n=1 Tax=Caedibacter taeniospiralis TaxID=28907 RepID=UPI000C28041B|nr:hypothetical protein [Caedibacter taeniospiralis]
MNIVSEAPAIAWAFFCYYLSTFLKHVRLFNKKIGKWGIVILSIFFAPYVGITAEKNSSSVDIPVTLTNQSSIDFYCSGLVIEKELASKYKLESGQNLKAEISPENHSGMLLNCWPQFLNYQFKILDENHTYISFDVGEFSRLDYYTISVSCTARNGERIEKYALKKGGKNSNPSCLEKSPIQLLFSDTE